MDRAGAIQEACAALAERGVADAAGVIAREYPFVLVPAVKRVIRERDAVAVFVRDGFIDRYSGQRLVFPGVLSLLAQAMPETFPYHPNWRFSATHPAFWELFPTIDHVVPVSRGGAQDPALKNWVTTSMLRNGAKGNWLLEELGWGLHPPGDMASWDGMLGWFLEYARSHPDAVGSPYLRRWHRAALSVERKW